jgi:parallel beta-helix repeat protein
LGATDLTAHKNTVKNDDNGLFLGLGTTAVTANGNTLRGNTVSSSTNDGILASSSSGGNTIVRNNSELNTGLDAQDGSIGSGTAGTANSWEANVCTTSDPSGLCRTAASPRTTVSVGTKERRKNRSVLLARHAFFR